MTLPAGYLDYLTICFCLVCWGGYTLYADRWMANKPSLMGTMRTYRQRWMQIVAQRDNRVVDTMIISLTMRTVSLFTSTSIFIVGGILTVLGSMDEARSIASHLSFVRPAPIGVWEVRMLILALIFTYAFFKFAWAIRQFNHTAVLIGAIPIMGEENLHVMDDKNLYDVPTKAAAVSSLAFQSYNRGIRAYYFGLAIPSGFIHPWLLIVATLWVINILHRREFRSKTFQTLGETS